MERRRTPIVSLVLALVVGASGFSASTATADVSAAGKAFVSKRYGYAIVLPVRFQASYAASGWNGTEFPRGSSGEVDLFVDPTIDRKFAAAAVKVPPGTTLRGWESAYVGVLEAGGRKRSRAHRATGLGGAAPREFQIWCPTFSPTAPGYDVIATVALSGGRGYFFQFVSTDANSAASDRQIYDAGKRTFRFSSK